MRVGIFTRKIDRVMGGMERQILLIASYLIESGIDVTVISLDSKSPKTFFEGHPKIKFKIVPTMNSDIKASLRQRISRQFQIFKLIRELQLDFIVSFSTGSLWYSAIPAKLSGKKLILAERNGPSVYDLTKAKKYKKFIFFGMLLCDAITVQFSSYINSYPRYLRSRIKVIPNEVPTFEINENLGNNIGIFKFAFVGRFCSQKQTLILVEAFIQFCRKNSNAELILIGEGEQRLEIRKLIDSYNIQDKIKVLPATSDVHQALKGIDVLIQPSLWEGFPNSVAEALAMGIPVAGFNDCEGIRDLVIHGKNGWLIDRNDKKKSIIDLLELVLNEKPEKIEEMRLLARKSMKEYSYDLASRNWQELFFQF